MLVLLLLAIFLLNKAAAFLPRVQFGGCTIIEDKAYYLDERIYLPNVNGIKSNEKLSTLDLKNEFKSVDNIVEWETYGDVFLYLRILLTNFPLK
ncbi:hypothetical protein K502DRAFT_114214 [Neoconidiobolus thromboides FSU 785]|nr:hypothetical protein K502DRAFT_114214 [Neoconidiobolus thromboides FSU 785]